MDGTTFPLITPTPATRAPHGRVWLRTALGHAEGAVGQAAGQQGACVGEDVADGAQSHGGGFLKHLHLVEDPKRDFSRSP
jgi:hypothetical protein